MDGAHTPMQVHSSSGKSDNPHILAMTITVMPVNVVLPRCVVHWARL
ncbi:MAG: hypothetical protein ACYCQM_01165 [Acidithiobacillus sp.]